MILFGISELQKLIGSPLLKQIAQGVALAKLIASRAIINMLIPSVVFFLFIIFISFVFVVIVKRNFFQVIESYLSLIALHLGG
jgi:hypothetical protein